MFWKPNRTNLKAVDDADFPSYLKKIGVYDAVLAGKEKCLVCGNILSLDEIEAIVPKDDQIGLVCNRPKCGVILASGDQAT